MKCLRIFLLKILMTMACMDGSAQNMLDSLEHYESSENFEKALDVIAIYEQKYSSDMNYDSLAYIMNRKLGLVSKFRSVDEYGASLNESIMAIEAHVSSTNKYLLAIQNRKANYFGQVGELEEAEALFNSIIETASREPKALQSTLLDANGDLAFLQLRKGNPQKAVEIAITVIEPILAGADTTAMINVLRVMSIANTWMLELDEALKYSLQAMPLCVSSLGKNHVGTGMIIEQVAQIYSRMGKSSEAIKYYDQVHKIDYYNYKKTGNGSGFASSLGNMGQLYSNLGEYRLALEYIKRGYQLNKEAYGEKSYTNKWYVRELMTVHRMYEDTKEAWKYFYELKQLFEVNKTKVTPYDRASIQFFEAELLYTDDRYEEAAKLASKSYEFFSENTEVGDPKDRMRLLNLLANIYIEMEDIEKATYWSNENLKWHAQHFERLNTLRCNALHGQLQLHRKTMDTVAARALHKAVLKLRYKGSGDTTLVNAIPDRELLVYTANWVKYLIEATALDASYEAEYFRFLDEFENYYDIHLSSIRTNSAIATNELFLKEIYSPAILQLLEKSPEASLQKSETVKSFGIRQVLQQRLIESDIITDLSADTGDEDLIFLNMTSQLDALQSFKDSLYRNDKSKFKKYFGMRKLELDSMRQLIDKDELLINLIALEKKVVIYYVSKESLRTATYDLDEIAKLVDLSLVKKDTQALEDLRELLLPSEIGGKYTKLLITPDGLLTNLNWEVLTQDGKPLLYSKRIRYALSPSILKYQNELANKNRQSNQLMGITPGFSDALKKNTSSIAEGDSSYQFYLRQPFLLSLSDYLEEEYSGNILKNEKATESAFYSNNKGYKILHIGTHGILNSDSPLFSKLVFAKDSIEDGYIHAFEIYGQNLNAQLAVLSACSSGKDGKYASQGVVSLARAFTHAGCPAILMSLWDVDEKSTSQILRLFYKNIKEGDTKSEALRKAKLEFISDSPDEYQDPYYWAGLVIIGSDVPLYEANSWISYAIGAGLVIMIVLLVFRYLKNK